MHLKKVTFLEKSTPNDSPVREIIYTGKKKNLPREVGGYRFEGDTKKKKRRGTKAVSSSAPKAVFF